MAGHANNGAGDARSHAIMAGLHLAARTILSKRREPFSVLIARGVLHADLREARTLLSPRAAAAPAGAWVALGGRVARKLVAGVPCPRPGARQLWRRLSGGFALDWHMGCRLTQGSRPGHTDQCLLDSRSGPTTLRSAAPCQTEQGATPRSTRVGNSAPRAS